ncbi:MAG: hypothetical protein K8R56_05595 [Candidatus Eisenbacteria bacterium]|nr:hypothetical protein [Candidatus Eisenbacteria bacterium]
MPSPTDPTRPLALHEVVADWLPLAGSWLLMGVELPVVSAVMARLPHATVSLAAYGGVVFPVALLIESPILMLLTASTALARDRHAYAVVRRFMWIAGGLLTVLHALLAFTPLFDVIAGTLIGVPEPVREPARMGLRIMLPWSMAIAYRRTQQGLMIRFGRARSITWGTLVRLTTLSSVLALGSWLGTLPGIVVGTAAVASGVVAEALFARYSVMPVRRGALEQAPIAATPLAMGAFLKFYTPLMLTPLLNFIGMPLAASAMSRMPQALESLAVWPVLSGATFTLRSVGFAYNEVVVALLDRARPAPALRRFAWILGSITSGLLLVGAATSLGFAWFSRGAALPDALATMAWHALWLLVPMGAVSVWQSLHQGALVHAHRTRAITESMAVLLVATATVLGVGLSWRSVPGLPVAAAGLAAGGLAQVAFLAWRAGPVWRELERRAEPV